MNKNEDKQLTQSWLTNSSFSSSLAELFNQLAATQSSQIHEPIPIPSPPKNKKNVKAMDYFEEEIDDEEENYFSNYNRNSENNSIILSSNETDVVVYDKTNKETNEENFEWVEKTADKKQKKKDRKKNKKKKDKRKRKEKELMEKLKKSQPSISKNQGQWGIVAKDESGQLVAMKENTTKNENKYFYWDPKPDKELIIYEKLYTFSIPNYFHAPSRFLGLEKTQHAKFLKQHQTYIVYNNHDSTSSENQYSRYFTGGNKLFRHPIKITAKNKFKKQEKLPEFLPLGGDNDDMETESDSDEATESLNYILRKTEEFNKLTHKEPHNVEHWKEFIKFQDEYKMEANISTKLIVEKKMSIYLRALQKNEESEELLTGYLDCCQQIWPTDQVLQLWNEVMSKKRFSVSLWEKYILFRCSNFSSFSVGDGREIFKKAIQSMFDMQYHAQKSRNLAMAVTGEENQLEFFRKYCLFEFYCGYFERCVSLFQAAIEFNCFYPKQFEDYPSRLKAFELFWDSESPRIGELRASGWSNWKNESIQNPKQQSEFDRHYFPERNFHHTATPPTTADKKSEKQPSQLTEFELKLQQKLEEKQGTTQFSNELERKFCEEHLQSSLWYPKKSFDPKINENGIFFSNICLLLFTKLLTFRYTKDMENVILFSDISDYIFPIQSDLFKVKLITDFIEFFLATSTGGKLTFIGSHGFHDDLNFNSTEFNQKTKEIETIGSYLIDYLPKYISVNDNLGPILQDPGVDESSQLEEVEEHKLFQPCIVSSNGREISSGISRDRLDFLRNLLEKALEKFPGNIRLHSIYVDLEANFTENLFTKKQRTDRVKEISKKFLANRSEDLYLWHLYGSALVSLGNFTEAKRIFDVSLASCSFTSNTKNYYQVVLSYAFLELKNPTIELDIIMIPRICYILICAFDKQFQSIFVKRTVASSFVLPDDLSTVPPSILPKLTPTRILLARKVFSLLPIFPPLPSCSSLFLPCLISHTLHPLLFHFLPFSFASLLSPCNSPRISQPSLLFFSTSQWFRSWHLLGERVLINNSSY